MLVLTRRLGESIFIGDNICITIVDIDRGKIRLGIEAPSNVHILRGELLTIQQKDNFHATATNPPTTSTASTTDETNDLT